MKMPFALDSVYTKTYSPPEIKLREILRYCGAYGESPELEALANECISELDGAISYRVCWLVTELRRADNELDFGFMKTDSASLAKNLSGCDNAVIFAATLGNSLDRIIAKYSRISPSKAVMLQAIGAERIEALCDAFCDEIKEISGGVRPRFSPGYGDLPLDFQKNIFIALDCSRKIGLTLNDSLLMSPSKSVTAIIGIKGEET